MSKKADRKRLANQLKALQEDNMKVRLAAAKLLSLAETKALDLAGRIDTAIAILTDTSCECTKSSVCFKHKALAALKGPNQ